MYIFGLDLSTVKGGDRYTYTSVRPPKCAPEWGQTEIVEEIAPKGSIKAMSRRFQYAREFDR